jgi:hypothetical protein
MLDTVRGFSGPCGGFFDEKDEGGVEEAIVPCDPTEDAFHLERSFHFGTFLACGTFHGTVRNDD